MPPPGAAIPQNVPPVTREVRDQSMLVVIRSISAIAV